MVLKKDRLQMYLTWIQNAIHQIQAYTKGISIEHLERDRMVLDSCLMQLIHIWEVANKISRKYPNFQEIAIKDIIGLRNFAAHDYLGVNSEVVKRVIKVDLPILQKQILEYQKKK